MAAALIKILLKPCAGTIGAVGNNSNGVIDFDGLAIFIDRVKALAETEN